MYPKALNELIYNLEKLPGVGQKTAERLALYILSDFTIDDAKELSSSITEAVEKIKPCKISFVLTDKEISPLLNDPKRNNKTIMVVADSKDVFMMEKMETYYGQYHVLGGLIDFSRGITDKDLNIEQLLKRIDQDVEELIIATNATVEGELTAQYLKTLLEDKNVSVTRLAYGLPVGTDLRYADVLTLIKAVENRRKY